MGQGLPLTLKYEFRNSGPLSQVMYDDQFSPTSAKALQATYRAQYAQRPNMILEPKETNITNGLVGFSTQNVNERSRPPGWTSTLKDGNRTWPRSNILKNLRHPNF